MGFVVPCYNQGRTVGEALDSICRQSIVDWNAVVVDDGSTDDTGAIAERWTADSRIRLIRQGNRGLSAARNAGLARLDVDAVAFLDADDCLHVDMANCLWDVLDRHPDVGVAHAGWERFSEKGWLAGGSDGFTVDLGSVLLANRFPFCAALVRSDAIKAVGLFDETLGALEDWDMLIRLALGGWTFQSEPRRLAYYRQCTGSMSRDASLMLSNKLRVIQKHSAIYDYCTRTRAIGFAYIDAIAAAMFQGQIASAANHLVEALHQEALAIYDRELWYRVLRADGTDGGRYHVHSISPEGWWRSVRLLNHLEREYGTESWTVNLSRASQVMHLEAVRGLCRYGVMQAACLVWPRCQARFRTLEDRMSRAQRLVGLRRTCSAVTKCVIVLATARSVGRREA